MIITVQVKTGARAESLVYDKVANVYLVAVKARPIEGDANKAIIKLLSNHLNVPKTQITLKSGVRSSLKRFEY